MYDVPAGLFEGELVGVIQLGTELLVHHRDEGRELVRLGLVLLAEATAGQCGAGDVVVGFQIDGGLVGHGHPQMG